MGALFFIKGCDILDRCFRLNNLVLITLTVTSVRPRNAKSSPDRKRILREAFSKDDLLVECIGMQTSNRDLFDKCFD